MIKDIAFIIHTWLFGKPDRIQFMIDLSKLAEKDERIIDFLKGKGDSQIDYLTELFEYTKSGGDLSIKLTHDMNQK